MHKFCIISAQYWNNTRISQF